MIHIKYKLDKSAIHGIGIFADQDIKKGELIYTTNPILDVNITQAEFDSLNEEEERAARYLGYWDDARKVWHVDFDNIHFINHSFTPNTSQDLSRPEAPLIATRDIKMGEELTQNYLDFESEDVLRKRGFDMQ